MRGHQQALVTEADTSYTLKYYTVPHVLYGSCFLFFFFQEFYEKCVENQHQTRSRVELSHVKDAAGHALFTAAGNSQQPHHVHRD